MLRVQARPGAVSMTGANAPTNATGDNIAISAPDDVNGDHINIIGAGTIALNGFATYTNAPDSPDGTPGDAAPNTQFITQAYLDEIDQDSQQFINGALVNSAFPIEYQGADRRGHHCQLDLKCYARYRHSDIYDPDGFRFLRRTNGGRRR